MPGTIDQSFWAGKRVFITGHSGFKGSWLSLWLQELGAKVYGFSLPPPTSPSLFELASVADRMVSTFGDIRDLQALCSAVSSAAPEIVLHLAAQPLVLESYETPLETMQTNIMGTAHVLDALRDQPSIRSVVVVTSDKCYANREWHWAYRENEAMGGADPYSMSKGCAELVTDSYRRSFFTGDSAPGIATARAGNVIGGGDYAKDRIITDIMAALRRGDPVQVRNPHAIRPWQHVLEPLNGYLMLAEALYEEPQEHSMGWNFGPGEEDARPVGWICDELTNRWGDDASWEVDGAEYRHEATYLKLDSSKARSELSWRSKLSLSQTLDWILDWNRCADNGDNLREVTIGQITTFQDS